MLRTGQEAADGGADEFELGGDGEAEEGEIDGDEAGGGAETAEGDGADEGDADEAVPEEQEDVAPQPRRESRYQRAIREAREAREEARRERALREQLERTQAQPRQTAPDPDAQRRQREQFLERLRMMDPAEAALAVADYERQNFARALQAVRADSFDRQDRAEFNIAARDDPAIARLRDRVEEAIQLARQQGNFTLTRMDLFYRIYGEEMAARRRTQPARQQREAQRRVQAQTTRPASGRGEAPRPARQPMDDDEALLRRITIGDL